MATKNMRFCDHSTISDAYEKLEEFAKLGKCQRWSDLDMDRDKAKGWSLVQGIDEFEQNFHDEAIRASGKVDDNAADRMKCTKIDENDKEVIFRANVPSEDGKGIDL